MSVINIRVVHVKPLLDKVGFLIGTYRKELCVLLEKCQGGEYLIPSSSETSLCEFANKDVFIVTI